jgi:hypothetical protein
VETAATENIAAAVLQKSMYLSKLENPLEPIVKIFQGIKHWQQQGFV